MPMLPTTRGDSRTRDRCEWGWGLKRYPIMTPGSEGREGQRGYRGKRVLSLSETRHRCNAGCQCIGPWRRFCVARDAGTLIAPLLGASLSASGTLEVFALFCSWDCKSANVAFAHPLFQMFILAFFTTFSASGNPAVQIQQWALLFAPYLQFLGTTLLAFGARFYTAGRKEPLLNICNWMNKLYIQQAYDY